MTATPEKTEYRLQIANSICWEKDPAMGDISFRPSTPSPNRLERVRFHISHSIREQPAAGSLPCHFTELWSVHAGAQLIRRSDTVMAQVLDKLLERDNDFSSPENWPNLADSQMTHLTREQISGCAKEIERMFREIFSGLQQFLENVGWCVGARLSSRLLEPGWPVIDARHRPGHISLHYPLDYQRWKNESIDTSDFIESAHAPFSSVMLREAWQANMKSDRIAMITAYFAAETATKECFSEIVPGGKYIVDGVQAPPLPNLMQMLIEHLDDDLKNRLMDESTWGNSGGGFCAVSTWLRKRANERNKVVHGSDIELDAGTVTSWLFLYEKLVTLLWLAVSRKTTEPSPAEKLFEKSWGN